MGKECAIDKALTEPCIHSTESLQKENRSFDANAEFISIQLALLKQSLNKVERCAQCNPLSALFVISRCQPPAS